MTIINDLKQYKQIQAMINNIDMEIESAYDLEQLQGLTEKIQTSQRNDGIVNKVINIDKIKYKKKLL